MDLGVFPWPTPCKPDPEGEICLHRTSDQSFGIPFIATWHSFSRAELRVPADRRLCRLVHTFDIIMAIFLFLGPCVAAPLIVINLMRTETKPLTLPVALFFTSISIAVICLIIRFRLIRNMRLVDHFDGRIKLCFLSEDYATNFARLNGCALD